MSQNTVIMPLAKVMIAAAWADGSISNEEVNCLKDLLFQLPEMTASDWSELEIYIDTPVGEAERGRLVADLQAAMAKRDDKELAIQMIDALAHADGELPTAEESVVDEIKSSIQDTNVNVFGGIGKLLGGSIKRRSEAVSNAPNRELYLDDYQKNRIFYSLSRRLELEQIEVDIPETELRKLSLAGGLMARVAWVDREIQDAELTSISAVIQEHWGLPDIQAALVAEIAASEISKGVDYYRLAREFFLVTSAEERLTFVEVLFAVADGHAGVSYDETEEIRQIAHLLKLTHRQFIDAKLRAKNDQG